MYGFNLNNFTIYPVTAHYPTINFLIYLHTLQSLKRANFHYKYIFCAIKDV